MERRASPFWVRKAIGDLLLLGGMVQKTVDAEVGALARLKRALEDS